MKARWIFPVSLFMFICSTIAMAQSTSGVKVIVLSIENIQPRPMSDLPPANVRLNFRIINDGRRDVFLFGAKYQKEFDVWYHLLMFDKRQGKWTTPIFNWDALADNERVAFRLRKGSHFDFSSLTSKANAKKLLKIATYFGYTKDNKPTMIESIEFYVDGANDQQQ